MEMKRVYLTLLLQAFLLPCLAANSPGLLIYISGPQCSGKTTLASLIDAETEGKWEHVEIWERIKQQQLSHLQKTTGRNVEYFERQKVAHVCNMHDEMNKIASVISIQASNLITEKVRNGEIVVLARGALPRHLLECNIPTFKVVLFTPVAQLFERLRARHRKSPQSTLEYQCTTLVQELLTLNRIYKPCEKNKSIGTLQLSDIPRCITDVFDVRSLSKIEEHEDLSQRYAVAYTKLIRNLGGKNKKVCAVNSRQFDPDLYLNTHTHSPHDCVHIILKEAIKKQNQLRRLKRYNALKKHCTLHGPQFQQHKVSNS